MQGRRTRREVLGAATISVGGWLAAQGTTHAASEAAGHASEDKPIRVVVWDEQQPAQKEAYENFLGNEIAEYLRGRSGLTVKSVNIGAPEQGLSDNALDDCDVLIWWGHVRNGEIAPEAGKKIVARIKAGTLSFIALHSAHWSTPFVEAMNERTRVDAEKALRPEHTGRLEVSFVAPPQRFTVPKADARPTPYMTLRKFPDGPTTATVHLPYCCFPAYRNDGKPSQVRVLRAEHPIVAGVPRIFELPHTEMYDEPFHVPEPDEVILEERWETGEWFRSGMVWTIGRGRVFYFRPGHETYAIYKQTMPLKILENAIRWLARTPV